MKNGEAPVYLRVTVNGIPDETRIKRSVPVDLWNQAKECSKGKDKKSIELNDYIRQLSVRLSSIHKEMLMEGAHVTSKNLLNKAFQCEKDTHTLLSVFKKHNEKCRKLIGIDYVEITVRRYDNCCKYIGELIRKNYGKEDLSLNEIKGEFIREFEYYLKIEKGCKQNTVIRYMKCFKKVIHMAIADELMIKNPFVGIKFREEVVTKEFLEKEELSKLIIKEFELERLELVRDVFLFCCFTGLAFVDVSELTKMHIFTDNQGKLWIRKDRHKIRK